MFWREIILLYFLSGEAGAYTPGTSSNFYEEISVVVCEDAQKDIDLLIFVVLATAC